MNTVDWKGKRVLILGAARQGLAAARWLARQGAIVTLNDKRSAEEMNSARQALADLPVNWVLGSHPRELLDATDVICLSGGIPIDHPLSAAALVRGIPWTNDTQIFLEVVPCRTIGITGSAGKSTTTALVGTMAQASLGETVFVGGNFGDPLLNHVEVMRPEDLAILEISSFQLEQMTRSTNIAAVLNITPNHLDRHGTMTAYTAAKRRILEHQTSADTAVLGREDAGSWGLRPVVKGRLLSFGFNSLPEGFDGTFLTEGMLNLRMEGAVIPLIPASELRLRGEHNTMNVLAAFAIGAAAGLNIEAMRQAARTFQGIPHRLEFVREWRGVQWYNDSIATAPERTKAAIHSFHEPIILLLGGRDKDLPWQDLAGLVRRRVDHVVLFGEAAEKIEQALAKEPGTYTLVRCPGLEQAVTAATRLATSGDVVLFSPGGTSFDQFRDFEERGEAFRKWVLELT